MCFCLTAFLPLLLYFLNQKVRLDFNLIWQRRGNVAVISLEKTLVSLPREVSVRSQNLHRTDMSTPITGKGAVSVHTLLDIIGTDSLKVLGLVGLFVCVCVFLPFSWK